MSCLGSWVHKSAGPGAAGFVTPPPNIPNHASPVERTGHYILCLSASDAGLDPRSSRMDASPEPAGVVDVAVARRLRERTHASSSGKSRWNSGSERGYGSATIPSATTSWGPFAQPEKHEPGLFMKRSATTPKRPPSRAVLALRSSTYCPSYAARSPARVCASLIPALGPI